MDTSSNRFLIKAAAAKRAADRLTRQPVHEHFAGYLAILHSLTTHPNRPVQTGYITAFFERYFQVKDGPTKYMMPFHRLKQRGLRPFNQNVAGSYAGSSLREDAPFRKVVNVSAAGLTLHENHATNALSFLLLNSKISSVALTLFIYRDYSLQLDPPSALGAVGIFRKEFGFLDNTERKQTFDTLFDEDENGFSSDDFQVIHG